MTGIDPALFELFREEAAAAFGGTSRGLLEVEADPANPARIEPLMRAAHSIKGACRIVGIDSACDSRTSWRMRSSPPSSGEDPIHTPPDIDTLLKGSRPPRNAAPTPPPRRPRRGDQRTPRQITRLEPTFVAMAGGKPASVSPSAVAIETPLPQVASVSSAFPPLPEFEPVAIPATPLELLPEHSMLDRFREELRGTIAHRNGRGTGCGSREYEQIRAARPGS